MNDEQLKEILDQHKNLIEKLAKSNKKDIWDKLSILIPFLSSLVIAAIGIYFTNAFKRQEVRVAEAQTIEKFMPHLTGTNENAKKGAILAMASLSDQKLAARLGALYASAGTIDAIEQFFKDANGESRDILKDFLIEAYAKRGTDLIDNKNDPQRAIKDYNRIHELEPDDNRIEQRWGKDFLADAYNNRGYAYYLSRNYDQAIKDYTEALKIKKDYTRALVNRAYAYIDKKDLDNSLKDVDLAVEKNPGAETYLWRGIFFDLKLGNFERAIDDFNKSISLDGNNPDPYYHLAIAYAKKGEYRNAANNFIRARDLYPGRELPRSIESDLRSESTDPTVFNKIMEEMDKITGPRPANADVRRP